MLIQTGSNYRNACLILSIFIIHGTKDDICVISCQLLHIACGVICLDQADVTGNIDDHMACTLNSRLKQRAGNGLLYSLNGLVVALCLADTDVCDALVDHNGLNICKVQIDKARNIDQVCNSLNCLLEHLICLLKSIRHGGPAVNDLQKTVIGDNDQSIHRLL